MAETGLDTPWTKGILDHSLIHSLTNSLSDSLLFQLHCCGGRSPQDYRLSYWFNHTKAGAGMFVPDTCCVLQNDDHRDPIIMDENRWAEKIMAMLYTEKLITKIYDRKQLCILTL